MPIGFIGTGRIARRLVGALAGQDHAIAVSRRNATVSAELAQRYPEVRVHDADQALVDASDTVFLCLPPEHALEHLRTLQFGSGQAVISVMAGIALADLQAVAPDVDHLAIIIPMPFIEQGGCTLPVYPDSEPLARLFGDANPVMPLASEAALTPFWASTGPMLTMLATLQTIATWLGERIGDQATAERYLTALYAGQLKALGRDGAGRIEEASADLAIAGGLNASVHDRLAASGYHAELTAVLEALQARIDGS